MLQPQCCVAVSHLNGEPNECNRVSPLDYEDSTIAATNSTLYVANHHAKQIKMSACLITNYRGSKPYGLN